MKFWYQFTADALKHPSFVAALHQHAERIGSPGTHITVHGMDRDLGHGLLQADVILSPAVYTSVVVPLFLRNAWRAQQQDYDAFVIGTFAEPVLRELRSLVEIPVVSAFEASMLAGCTVAPKMALLVLSEQTVPYVEASIERHRLASRVSGIQLVDSVMLETELERQFEEPAAYLDRFKAAARKAIAAGADAVIPAEGMVAAIVAVNGLQEVDGVPVIDSVGAAILGAEYAITLKRRLGIQPSRLRAYTRPTPAALSALGQTWSGTT